MKISKSNFSFLVLLIFTCNASISQEPLITENRFSNLSRNPALAGFQVDDLKISLNYRNQLKTILLPYRSLQIQIESTFKRKETEDGFTAGALISYDEAGENNLKRAQFLPVLNFHKALSDIKKSYLSMGFMTGIYKSQFDLFTLPTVKNYQPIPFNPRSSVPQYLYTNSSSYFDFSTGLCLYSEFDPHISWNLAIALFHFSQNALMQTTNIHKIPREWVINGGIYVTNNNYSLQLFSDLRINKTETKWYGAFIWGIPIHRDMLNQVTEFQLGSYFNSNRELSPSISLNLPGILFSCSYNILIGSKKQLPILGNAIETNIVININCHKRNNESEKMHCYY